MKTIDVNGVQLTEEALQEIVEALGKSVKPHVLYRPDPQQMAEEALNVCQKNARAVLKVLSDALPAHHWLRSEIDSLLDDAVALWDRYPF